jgi:HK97 family phage major capsid protein
VAEFSTAEKRNNMKVNTRELSFVLGEYNELSAKVRHTKEERTRMTYLQTAIAAIRSGATLSEVNEQYLNQTEERNGLPMSKLPTSGDRQRQQEYRFWIDRLEKRDVEGAPMITHIGTYSGLGFFVPTGFFDKVWDAMKASDALFDDEAVTLIKTTNGRPFPVPTMDATAHNASVLGEAAAASVVSIGSTGQGVLGAYSYASDYWPVSLEVFQDLDTSLTTVELFRKFTGKALARGIGRDLVIGDGVTKPLGLIPSLENAGATVVTAAGSAANTGGSETGATSIGSADFSTALSALDSAYTDSPSIAWLMNRSTLNSVAGIVTKQGLPLGLVKYDDNGKATIHGIPVKICPSMDSIGVSNIPVVLGDLSYWATRIVTPSEGIANPKDGEAAFYNNLGIKVFKEATGLIENGLVALRSFVRADGELLWSTGPSPFVVVRNHS